MPDAQETGTKGEHWERVRDIVKHEDILIDQRLSWLLNSHLFLYATFAALQSAMLAYRPHFLVFALIEALSLMILAIGYRLCRILSRSIDMATAHIDHAKRWWAEKYVDEGYHHREEIEAGFLPWEPADYELPDDVLKRPFPPVVGDFGFDFRKGVNQLPRLFTQADAVLILFVSLFLGASLYYGEKFRGRTIVEEVTLTKEPAQAATKDEPDAPPKPVQAAGAAKVQVKLSRQYETFLPVKEEPENKRQQTMPFGEFLKRGDQMLKETAKTLKASGQ